MRDEVEAILQRALDTLATARHGYDDLTGPDRSRRMSGLRNLIVFGRSVTFVLQNLRSAVGDAAFDGWYVEERALLVANPLARYFVDARNAIEKQGRLSVGTKTYISSFQPDIDMRRFGPPPQGTRAFFIGDNLGGTGWEVALPNGKMEKYYVALPIDIGEVTQHFSNLPTALDPDLRDKPIEVLCDKYLNMLGGIIKSAATQFGNDGAHDARG